MAIYISSDHRGYDLKRQLLEQFPDFIDVDTAAPDDDDDYPDSASRLCNQVVEDFDSFGVLICGSGVGMSIAANKFVGIRAALAWTPEVSQTSRSHNNSNVLVLPADYVGFADAVAIVEAYLETPFSGVDRHVRRLTKIQAIEDNEDYL